MKRCVSALPVLSLVLAIAGVASAQEDPKTIVAAAVRDKGHQCASPNSVEPDRTHSGPDEKAWIIHCEGGVFRVRFKGDTGPEVEPVER